MQHRHHKNLPYLLVVASRPDEKKKEKIDGKIHSHILRFGSVHWF